MKKTSLKNGKMTRAGAGWAAFYLVLLASLILGCGAKEEEEVRILRHFLRAAADELDRLGAEKEALNLLEESWRMEPSLDEAVQIAEKWVPMGGERAAGECLERLYPPPRPSAVEELILEAYLEGWSWENARVLLEKKGDDDRLAKIQDLLGRTRSLTESFQKPYALSWLNSGFLVLEGQGYLALSTDEWWKGMDRRFTAPVGWNGEGFRAGIALLVKEIHGSRLEWGIFGKGEEAAVQSFSRAPFILLEIEESQLALACHSMEKSSADAGLGVPELRDSRSWNLPLLTWLSLEIEYVPSQDRHSFECPAAGQIKSWIEIRETGERLCTLKVNPAGPFAEGRIDAGLRLCLVSRRSEAWEVYLDDFYFIN